MAEVKVRASSGAAAERALDAAFRELEEVEDLLSAYREESDISRIHASAGGSRVHVDGETIRVLNEAKRVGALSGGAFDITIGPLLGLWGFGSGSYRVPGEDEVEAVLSGLAGSDGIEIDGAAGTVRLAKPGMGVDLGGIAKGYGVDRAARALRENGVGSGIVNVGGDLFCLGEAPSRIGIRHPREAGVLVARLTVANAAVATSGDYENYFEAGGRRYCHIFDARTGRPAETDIASVTVVAESCMLADAVATAVFVLGAGDGMALVEGLGGVEAVMVTENDGRIELIVSPGLEERVERIE